MQLIKYIDYYSYRVFEDGSVYSFKTKKFLKGEITIHGYLQYTLSVEGKLYRIKAHRLVAMLFLPMPYEFDINSLVVNHKDGNKLNNHISNLEWCSYYENNLHARDTGLNNISESNKERWKDDEFRKRVSKNISEGLKKSESNKGSNNPNFRYLITDINGNIYSREELANLLNLSLSRTDFLIRYVALGNNSDYFNKHNIIIIDTKSQSQSTIENN